MNSVLVIDDDAAIRSLLERSLSYDGYTVSSAASGEEGLKLALQRAPDLIVLDLMMPGMGGYEVLRRLRAAGDETPVLCLTGCDAPEEQIAGFEAGADDYVVKPISPDLLLARVRTLLRRGKKRLVPALRFCDITLNLESFTVTRGKRTLELNNLEFRLFHELMVQTGRVLSKRRLFERVWGDEDHGGSNVIEVYIMMLRKKLEAGGEPRVIHTIRGLGYVLR